jgi:hypothetical protein
MPSHIQRLGDLAGRMIWVEVRCGHCDRHGRPHLGRLIAEHGADAGVPDLLRAIVGDCPKREAFNVHDPFVPGLAG